jgi:membrane protein YdbS with pleckstrin-like domain
MTTKLLAGEHLRCLARPHWIVLVRSLAWVPFLLAAAGLMVVGLHAAPLPAGASLLATPILLLAVGTCTTGAGVAFISWSSRFVLVTDVRAIQQSGVVRKRRTMIPLDRIQDVSTERGLLGTLLDYGDIIVTTAGLPVAAASPKRRWKSGGEGMVARPSLVLPRVRAPEQVARSLFEQPFRRQGTSWRHY